MSVVLSKTTESEVISQCIEQREFAVHYKQGRVASWQRIEDLYYLRPRPALKGRLQAQLPIMSGFLDTLQAKLDDQPALRFSNENDEADYKKSKKVTAQWDYESGPDKERWAQKDRIVVRLASFSGRGIYKIIGHPGNNYRTALEAVDHYDFLAEPNGGYYLENHQYHGEDNIRKTEQQLKDGVAAGLYDSASVAKLLATQPEDKPERDDMFNNKDNRLIAIGLSPLYTNYKSAAGRVFRLAQMITHHKGKKWYVLFDPDYMIGIRVAPLESITKSNLSPYVSFGTFEDPFNFWNKGPADDIVQVAEAMELIFNQALDNRQKINYRQRAFDAKIFPDPVALEWGPDKLTRGNAVKYGRNLRDGIYEFDTGEFQIQGTINLSKYMHEFLGTSTGITDAVKGSPDTDKVGIHFSNLEQIADRLGMQNKQRYQAWVDLGKRYIWSLKENMPPALAVKTIGENGREWGELLKSEIDPNFDVKVNSGTIDKAVQENKKQRFLMAFDKISGNPELATQFNPRWLAEKFLSAMTNADENEIKIAMDTQGPVNPELMSEAASVIQKIKDGEDVKENRGADIFFVIKIVESAHEDELPLKIVQKLVDYGMKHLPIAQRNMQRRLAFKQMAVAFSSAQPPQSSGGKETSPAAPGQIPSATPSPTPEPSPVSINNQSNAG